MEGDADSSWKRLAVAVRERRLQLGMTQREAADAGGDGLSLAVWSLLERAGQDRYRDRTLIAVERALGWPRGAVAMILEGGDAEWIAGLNAHQAPNPTPVGASATPGTASAPLEARVADLERSMIELRRQMAAFEVAVSSRADLGLAADADRPTSVAEVKASRRRHRPAPDPNE